jgi:hypothetical protein
MNQSISTSEPLILQKRFTNSMGSCSAQSRTSRDVADKVVEAFSLTYISLQGLPEQRQKLYELFCLFGPIGNEPLGSPCIADIEGLPFTQIERTRLLELLSELEVLAAAESNTSIATP